MRHCRRTHFSRFDFLLEILHRNVLPEVPVEIYHNRVDTTQSIEQSGEIVIIRNLSGPLLPVYPQPLLQKSIHECRPIDIGISKTMSIEITGSSSELTAHRNRFEQSHLPFQPIAKYPYLFPQTGGRCRLPVSFGKHGNIFPFLGIPVDNSQHIFQHWEITIVQSLFQQKRNRRIINILWSQPEMDKLFISLQMQFVEFLFNKILDSLHIMISNRLYRLHFFGIGLRKIGIYLAQRRKQIRIYPRELRKRQFAQCNEILDFDPYPIPDKCPFRKIKRQIFHLIAIAAIDRRYSREWW